jgi:hypothetical protein
MHFAWCTVICDANFASCHWHDVIDILWDTNLLVLITGSGPAALIHRKLRFATCKLQVAIRNCAAGESPVETPAWQQSLQIPGSRMQFAFVTQYIYHIGLLLFYRIVCLWFTPDLHCTAIGLCETRTAGIESPGFTFQSSRLSSHRTQSTEQHCKSWIMTHDCQDGQHFQPGASNLENALDCETRSSQKTPQVQAANSLTADFRNYCLPLVSISTSPFFPHHRQRLIVPLGIYHVSGGIALKQFIKSRLNLQVTHQRHAFRYFTFPRPGTRFSLLNGRQYTSWNRTNRLSTPKTVRHPGRRAPILAGFWTMAPSIPLTTTSAV